MTTLLSRGKFRSFRRLSGINHSKEVEAIGGGSGARLTSVSPQEKFGHPFGRASPSPDLDQAPGNGSDHVVEKAVRREEDTDHPAPDPDFGGEDLTDRVTVAPGRSAERGKIMFPPEKSKGLPHGATVQIPGHPPGPPTPEDGFNGSIQDHIGVSLGQSPATGVKIRRNLVGLEDPDVSGQPVIQRPLDGESGEVALGLEVGNLPEGMDSGVGPACADQGRAEPRELLESLLKVSLNSWAIGLDLPSVIGLTRVLNDEPDLPHLCGPN